MRKATLSALICLGTICAYSQNVGINNDGSSPDSSAILDVKSMDKGILIPRTDTSTINTAGLPATGLLIYQSSDNRFYYYNGTAWIALNNLNGAVDKIDDLSDGSSNDVNLFIGIDAGANQTGNDGNVGVGFHSLKTNMFGKDNTALGIKTLTTNTASNNTAIGAYAMEDNTLGTSNTAIGSASLRKNSSGFSNTAVGAFSLTNNTTGTSNSALGTSALLDNTTGDGNTGLGAFSLQENTTGNSNTAAGSSSLQNNTSGTGNTSVGRFSLTTNSIGNSNTSIGSNSMQNNTTGNNNTAIGYVALLANTSGSENSAMGYYALGSNISGQSNIAIGNRSLFFNTSGISNIAIGVRALYRNTDRQNLVAIGDSALYNNGTGTEFSVEATANTAIGSKALYSNTTGYVNTAVGYQSLYSNTSGQENVAVGNLALYSNTTGGNNIANGYQALYTNTSGNRNIAIGSQSLYLNTSGYLNVAIGRSSLYSNTTGFFNTAISGGALTDNTAGERNTGVGYISLRHNTTGIENTGVGMGSNFYNEEGSRNTIIGYDAGRGTSVHNKSGNVFIGYKSGYYETGNDKLYIENSNSNNLGALIYGEFDNNIVRINGELQIKNAYAFPQADGSNGQILASNGSGVISWVDNNATGNAGGDLSGSFPNPQIGTAKVGANELSSTGVGPGTYGTSQKTSVITVDSDGRITSASNTTIGFPWTTSASDIYRSSGNVGIGTATPTSDLEINGGDNTDALEFDAGKVRLRHHYDLISSDRDFLRILIDANDDQTNAEFGIYKDVTTSSGNTASVKFNLDGFSSWINGGGNLGIGTVAPAHPLHMGSGAHVTAGGVWTNASDISKKESIEDLEYGLDAVMQMMPKQYLYKTDSSESIGFIAQEMEEIIPEVVSGEEGEKGIAYGLLTATLVNAIKEQQKTIDELLMRIEKLENE